MGVRAAHGRESGGVSAPLEDPVAFIRANTLLAPSSLVPEVRLHLADEAIELWRRTEDVLGESDLPPPYWAFAWAGGQALARHVLDHPDLVAGRRVLDFASGSGIVAIAALKAGAASVVATEIDAFARAAILLNAQANGVEADLAVSGEDATAGEAGRFDVVLAGDVFYEKPMATRVGGWLVRECAAGTAVLVGDPGRSYLPKAELDPVAEYRVPVPRAIEDSDLKHTRIWRFRS
ncbi:Predicted nicotinamide N-methyase [Pseudoxanthobacter soli DSM 19599]|uniref:Predicted nicotinamide N-methyase n=1 Tax=Pseudoxanthobacter soli DSM 19599 TaxID=1123029 RepID=A0A1M7ZM46_9HYPH|nr:Predicted nicotinamide N-methyase [Pseudoxanthobacter soli DSM 19599]